MPSVDLDKLKRQGRQLLDGFTTGQKVMTVLALVAMLAGGYLFTQWASKPSYAPLFTNLEANDAAQITEKLGAKGTPYRLEDGGRTVAVPQDRVYQLRMELTAQGLPSDGGPGFSLLDKQGITTSEFRQRVDYQRAMQGELARTISSLDAVSSAAVHLVIPAEDVFSDDAERPSASVLIKTAPGKELGPGQVEAIVNLVAGSVAEMKPEDVTVVDTAGRALSVPGADGISALAGDANATQTAQFETKLANSVQQMLEKVMGPGRAVVRVSAALDFSQRASTTESYDNGLAARAAADGDTTEGQATTPTTAPAQPLQEISTEETYTGSGTGGATGPLGPDGTPMVGTDGSGTDYSKTERSRTYAIDKTVAQVREAPGTVKRLSVSVMLDAKKVDDRAAQGLEAAIGAAVGLDPDRGDTLEVTRFAFDQSTAKAAADELKNAEAAKQRAEMMSLLRTVLAGVVILGVLFVGWRAARRASRRGPARIAIDPSELAAAPVVEAPEVEIPVVEAPEVEIPAEIADALRERARDEAELAAVLERQPEEVAVTLRSWLAERP